MQSFNNFIKFIISKILNNFNMVHVTINLVHVTKCVLFIIIIFSFLIIMYHLLIDIIFQKTNSFNVPNVVNEVAHMQPTTSYHTNPYFGRGWIHYFKSFGTLDSYREYLGEITGSYGTERFLYATCRTIMYISLIYGFYYIITETYIYTQQQLIEETSNMTKKIIDKNKSKIEELIIPNKTPMSYFQLDMVRKYAILNQSQELFSMIQHTTYFPDFSKNAFLLTSIFGDLSGDLINNFNIKITLDQFIQLLNDFNDLVRARRIEFTPNYDGWLKYLMMLKQYCIETMQASKKI